MFIKITNQGGDRGQKRKIATVSRGAQSRYAVNPSTLLPETRFAKALQR